MMRLTKGRGFTLVEIMIVVAIIALLAAIAVPNLLRARLNANQTAAAATVKAINASCQSYAGSNPNLGYPATLAVLTGANPPYIDPTVDTVTNARPRQGYNFVYTQDVAGPPATRFHIFADPQTDNVTGVNCYFCDESGVVYYSATAGDVDPGQQANSGADPGANWEPLE